MYTIFKGGARIAVIEADDVKVDLTNPEEPVFIFLKGDKEGCLEQNEGTHVPYLDWQPRRKKKGERFKRHLHRDEAIKRRKDKEEKDKKDREDRDKRDKKDKEDKNKGGNKPQDGHDKKQK